MSKTTNGIEYIAQFYLTGITAVWLYPDTDNVAEIELAKSELIEKFGIVKFKG